MFDSFPSIENLKNMNGTTSGKLKSENTDLYWNMEVGVLEGSEEIGP